MMIRRTLDCARVRSCCSARRPSPSRRRPVAGRLRAAEFAAARRADAGRTVRSSAPYAFFLVLMLFYLWTIWNRLSKVEKDMQELARRQGGAAR